MKFHEEEKIEEKKKIYYVLIEHDKVAKMFPFHLSYIKLSWTQ